MKRRFTEEQIVAILNEADLGKMTIGQLCRAKGISEPTYYHWRKKYAGLEISDVRRLRELTTENARLKRMLAERDLEIDAMKELVKKKW